MASSQYDTDRSRRYAHCPYCVEGIKDLYQYIVDSLSEHDKCLKDIVWVGTQDGNSVISTDLFLEQAKDEPCIYIADSLVIVGNDWWLEYAEYDGGVWLEYKTIPVLAPFPIVLDRI